MSTTWLFNGAAAAPPINSNPYVVNIEKIGNYQVRITETWPSSLACTNLSQLVSIAGPPNNRLFIFPSPNDGTFTVSYFNNGGNSTQRQLVIFDAKGSMVYKRQFPISGSYTLLNVNMKQASRGIYTVLVFDVNGNRLAEGKVHIQ